MNQDDTPTKEYPCVNPNTAPTREYPAVARRKARKEFLAKQATQVPANTKKLLESITVAHTMPVAIGSGVYAIVKRK